ncbi:MAG: type II secretion system protein [Alphaproteobacteria bacterium]|nr:type II secretion system protein [Alphaproteobacteria bacterium]
MFSKNKPSQARKGFTLTEIAIVLGIMGLILGAIWTAASSVYANQRTAHAQTAILQIAQGVRTLYTSQGGTGYTALTDITVNLNSAGVIPSDLNGGATGPFPNGRSGIIATSDGNGFVVVVTGVPQSNCINLIAGIAGANRDPGLFSASAVADAAIGTGDAGTGATFAPLQDEVSPTEAAAATVNDGNGAPIGGCNRTTLSKVRFGFSIK